MKTELHWSEEVEQKVIAHRKRNAERFQALIIRDAARQARRIYERQEWERKHPPRRLELVVQ